MRRFVGLCADGQYLALHVLRHIAEQHSLELWDGMYAFLYLVYTYYVDSDQSSVDDLEIEETWTQVEKAEKNENVLGVETTTIILWQQQVIYVYNSLTIPGVLKIIKS